jgi:hypothetical protein
LSSLPVAAWARRRRLGIKGTAHAGHSEADQTRDTGEWSDSVPEERHAGSLLDRFQVRTELEETVQKVFPAKGAVAAGVVVPLLEGVDKHIFLIVFVFR